MHVEIWSACYLPRIGGGELLAHEIARRVTAHGQHRVTARALGVSPSWPSSRWGFRATFLLDSTFAPPRPAEYLQDDISVHPIRLGLGARARVLAAMRGFYRDPELALDVVSDALAASTAGAPRPDVIHAIGCSPTTLAASKVAIAEGVPLVSTPLLHVRPGVPLLDNCVERDVVAAARVVLTMTEVERERLIEVGVPPGKLRVAGSGPILEADPDPERARRTLGLGDAPVILFAGRLAGYKGADLLGAAMPRIWEAHPEARLVLLGPTSARDIRATLGLDDERIHPVGLVDSRTKTDAVAAATVLCVPSKAESFGLVYVEAGALGVPVVASRIPQVEEVVVDGETGLLPERTPEAIAAAIVSLLGDPKRRAAMGQAARTRCAERYIWERTVTTTLAAYGDAAAAG